MISKFQHFRNGGWSNFVYYYPDGCPIVKQWIYTDPDKKLSCYRFVPSKTTGFKDLLGKVKDDLNSRLAGTGFHFELVSFLDAPRADRRVMEAINATIEATQRAIEAQAKIVQSKAEAEQAIEQARGESESRRLRAVAEAESIRIVAEEQAKANELVNKSLTPMMVQWKALERWDGTAPMVMGSDVMPMMQMSK